MWPQSAHTVTPNPTPTPTSPPTFSDPHGQILQIKRNAGVDQTRATPRHTHKRPQAHHQQRSVGMTSGQPAKPAQEDALGYDPGGGSGASGPGHLWHVVLS
ncbi:unnamed protein product [Ostreobium quekettii]|uniref:Uncharacterized protein n=1 Tax=Ostreobium quekettii TaxID=121088 RepID=A0A8S1IPF0_9CHLO|nr:unnamed protein product [Ostreobium quekettii]